MVIPIRKRSFAVFGVRFELNFLGNADLNAENADIYDNQGRMIHQVNLTQSTNMIDLQHLSNGSYLIILRDKENEPLGKWNIVKTN